MALSPLTIDMRELWKQVRLDSIRSAVEEVIGQLEVCDGTLRSGAGEPSLDLHRPLGPRRAALQTCCDELRVGCGMAPLHVAPDPPPPASPDPQWDADNAAALEGYRSRARVALREALGLVPDGPL